MVSGIVIMVILSLIDYSFILRFSWIIYLLAVGLLALVLVAGDSSKGAQRWFEIGGIRFQPSELVKILLILFFAYYFMKYEEKINTVRVIVSSFVLLAIPLFLIYKQPNLSTMIVITLVFCALLFMAGLNYKLVVGVLIVCIPVGLIGMTLIIQDNPIHPRLSAGAYHGMALSGRLSGSCLPAAEFDHGDRFRTIMGKRT